MIKIDKIEKATQKLRQTPQKPLKSAGNPGFSAEPGAKPRFHLAFTRLKPAWVAAPMGT
jgi:hypothetical protein